MCVLKLQKAARMSTWYIITLMSVELTKDFGKFWPMISYAISFPLWITICPDFWPRTHQIDLIQLSCVQFVKKVEGEKITQLVILIGWNLCHAIKFVKRGWKCFLLMFLDQRWTQLCKYIQIWIWIYLHNYMCGYLPRDLRCCHVYLRRVPTEKCILESALADIYHFCLHNFWEVGRGRLGNGCGVVGG